MDVFTLLDKMHSACPIKCYCNIRRDPQGIVLEWNYEIGKEPYRYSCIVSRLQYMYTSAEYKPQLFIEHIEAAKYHIRNSLTCES